MKSPDQPASAAPSAQQTAIDIAVEKIVYGGEGLARTTEGVLLVPGVIPGERAAVRPEPARKGVRRGELVELLAPSSDRVQPGCPYFGRCGGCQHQQISYPRQLEIKSGVLRECCERIGKFDPGEIGVIASEPWAYRNRVRLRVVKEAGGLAVGYLEGASHQLCAIDQCPISSPALQRAIQGMNAGEIAALFPAGVAELELFVSNNNRELLATIYSEQEPPASFGERWMELWREGSGPPLVSVCWSRRRLSRAGRVQDRLWGAGALT